LSPTKRVAEQLCRMPRDAGEVAQIATPFGCDPQALAELAGVGAKGNSATAPENA
jgi:hypothetical protein